MKDLEQLVKECKADLDTLGIKYGNVSKFTVNSRAKRRWGECKRVALAVFEISISDRLLNDDLDDKYAKNTIIHELLHTVSGCFGHKGRWTRLAEYVNQKMPQYCIERVSGFEELGNVDEKAEYKYIIKCSGCGQTVYRQRKSRLVTDCKKYRCAKCGGKFERIL